jgi:small-conductance mechanosensitive channel
MGKRCLLWAIARFAGSKADNRVAGEIDMFSSASTAEKVEQLKQNTEIQKALDQASAPPQEEIIASPRKQKLSLGTHLIAIVLLTAFHYLVRLQFFKVTATYFSFLNRLSLGALAVAILLAIVKVIDVYVIQSVADSASRYNIKRIVRLIAGLIIAFIVISIIFANWYTAVVSVGLVSLILGFALQTPITSFIAWIYILVRTPYRVGDRIKIGEATGDVIDVGYLDTTLWEFGGEYLSTDHPSGRLIKFPNSRVLNSAVYNYSWPLFPYIWNEIKFNLAYESDLQFVAQTLQRIAEDEIGAAMLERVRTFRSLLAETPVDQLEVREHPAVIFRISNNTWLEAIVRYLVEPRQAGRVKNRLIEKMLAQLNAAPDKVMFPKGAAR